MQDIESLKPSEMAAMEALGRIRFMTTPQLVRAGASPSMRHMQRTLRQLMQRARPLVGGLEFGSIPTLGRLPRIHYLTERGATILEDAGHNWDSIKWPRKVRLFPHDYFHRIDCVDFHIELELWAAQYGAHVGIYNAYYDTGKIGADGRANPASRVAWPENSFVPDSIFTFTTSDNVTRLCAFEMHKGKDFARLMPALKKYVTASRLQALETPYGVQGSARILIVCDNETTLHKIRFHVVQHNILQERAPQFFGKTLDEVKADFKSNWWPLGADSAPIPLF